MQASVKTKAGHLLKCGGISGAFGEAVRPDTRPRRWKSEFLSMAWIAAQAFGRADGHEGQERRQAGNGACMGAARARVIGSRITHAI